MRPDNSRLAVPATSLLACASLAATAIAQTDPLDWSKAPLIDDGKLLWILQIDQSSATASYGLPESDHVILTMSCDNRGTLTASHVDAEFEPYSRYDVYLRIGKLERQSAGTTQERWEMDDLVELKFPLPSEDKFITFLKSGENLSILFKGPGQDGTGFSVPMPKGDLEPFFKTCDL